MADQGRELNEEIRDALSCIPNNYTVGLEDIYNIWKSHWINGSNKS